MPPKSTPITKTCAHCGKTFERPDWEVWRKAMYCGHDCYTDARRALPADQRAALMAKATDRIRGSKRSHDDLCKRARTKQDRLKLSGDEQEIKLAFQGMGWYPVPHYAVDKYNIDFAFVELKIGIEYNGGNWHNTPKKIAEDQAKSAYLASQGWTLLVFPRLAKRRRVDSGNPRIHIDDLVRAVHDAIHREVLKGLANTRENR